MKKLKIPEWGRSALKRFSTIVGGSILLTLLGMVCAGEKLTEDGANLEEYIFPLLIFWSIILGSVEAVIWGLKRKKDY